MQYDVGIPISWCLGQQKSNSSIQSSLLSTFCSVLDEAVLKMLVKRRRTRQWCHLLFCVDPDKVLFEFEVMLDCMLWGGKQLLYYITACQVIVNRPCDVQIEVSLVLFKTAQYKFDKVRIKKSRSPLDPNHDSTQPRFEFFLSAANIIWQAT